MEVKDLELKVEKAKEKVEKCKKTIERHQNQLEKKKQVLIKLGVDPDRLEEFKWKPNGGGGSQYYWEICDVERKLDDIKGATRKLKDAEEIFQNWKAKLHKEIEREEYIQNNIPQVIKDFLQQWKEKCYEWYLKSYEGYVKLCKELEEDQKKTIREYAIKAPEYAQYRDENGNFDYEWRLESNFHSKGLIDHLKECELDSKTIYKKQRDYLGFSGWVVTEMTRIYNEEERLKFLDKTLEQDKKVKMLDLIYRINEVVGTITDAKGLRISEKGNLDGIIVGDKGTAKVETIGAGGYAVQVFHYRTLVHKIS